MINWQVKKSAPSLAKNEVHIWRAFLDWPAHELQQALLILSPAEKNRMQRFVFEEHRSRFVVSHAILRHILSYYMNRPVAEFEFYQNNHGKPYLREVPKALGLQFNMSDSKDLALYAITTHREIGIDIEWMRPDVDVEGIANRFFSVAEQRELLALPPEQRVDGFYRCWTRKEAYIKVIGQGLSFPLSQFSVSLCPEGRNNLLSVHDSVEQAKRWSLCSIQAAEGYAAALAVEGGIGQIQYFDWEIKNLF